MRNFAKLYYYSPIFVFIMLLRASLDPLLALIQIGPFTAGAALNIIMLALFCAVMIRMDFHVHKRVMPWFPLLFITGFSLFYTSELVDGAKSFLVMVTYMAVFAIPFHFIKSEKHYVECIKLIVYSSIIPILAASHDLMFPEQSTNVNGFRLFSTFNHPNVFAFYLVTILSVCFYSIKSDFFAQDNRFRQHCVFIMFLALLCILGTKTRSAWVVVALLIVVWGVFRDRRYLFYFVAAAVAALFVPGIQDRILDLFHGNDTDAFLDDYERLNSLAWRKIIWAGAIEKFWERPILGFGYESFTHYSGHFFLIETDGEGGGAHNTYVQILFELGILGIVSFIYFLARYLFMLVNELSNAKENIIIVTLFISYCLIHYSDNVFDYLVFNWYFWFFISSFLAYSKIKSEKE